MGQPRFRARGLYAVTPSGARSGADLVAAVEQAIVGQAACVQYRDKHSPAAVRLAEAMALRALCRSYGVPFIVNDWLDLALAVEADGVHLGGEDIDCESARAALGAQGIVGVSCYNSIKRALHAQSVGADYVAFGRFFPSPTKPCAVRASVALLRQAKRRLEIPIVAIGGITPANGGLLVAAGVDLLAAIDGLFGEDDVKGAALRYCRLFIQPRDVADHDPI